MYKQILGINDPMLCTSLSLCKVRMAVAMSGRSFGELCQCCDPKKTITGDAYNNLPSPTTAYGSDVPELALAPTISILAQL